MIVLITDPYSRNATTALTDWVETAGLVPDETVDLGDDPDVIQRYNVSIVPCIACVHDGRVIDCPDMAWLNGKSAATLKGRFTNAVKAYEAERAGA